MRILALDDDPFVLLMVQAALEQEHELRALLVAQASDLSRVASIAQELSPHVLVTDLEMPIPVAEAVSAVRTVSPRVRVIVISGAVQVEEVATRLGAQAFLTKPFAVSALRRAIGERGDSDALDLGPA